MLEMGGCVGLGHHSENKADNCQTSAKLRCQLGMSLAKWQRCIDLIYFAAKAPISLKCKNFLEL